MLSKSPCFRSGHKRRGFWSPLAPCGLEWDVVRLQLIVGYTWALPIPEGLKLTKGTSRVIRPQFFRIVRKVLKLWDDMLLLLKLLGYPLTRRGCLRRSSRPILLRHLPSGCPRLGRSILSSSLFLLYCWAVLLLDLQHHRLLRAISRIWSAIGHVLFIVN